MARYFAPPADYRPGLVYQLRYSLEGGDLRPTVLQLPNPDASGRREAVVLVHGFNNHYGEAARAYQGFRNQQYRRYGDDLRAPALEALLADTHWPGDAAWGVADLADFLVYPVAVGTARQAGPILAAYLSGLPNLEIVHFLGHSLGCRVVLETVRHLSERPRVGKVCLMAAAVPVSKVEWGGELESAMTRAQSVLVLYSGSDLVLTAAFPPGQTLASGSEGFFPTALGHERPPPTVAGAVEAIDVPGAAHGHYWGHEDNAASRSATRHAGDFLGLMQGPRSIEGRAAGAAAGEIPQREMPAARQIG